MLQHITIEVDWFGTRPASGTKVSLVSTAHDVGSTETSISNIDAEDQPITPEELEEFLRVKPMTGAEIVKAGFVGGWEHKGITDSVAWVEEQRRKRGYQAKW